MGLWADLLIMQTIIGYSFVIANVSIGLFNIKDLNKMKGDIIFVRAHKLIGTIETLFFYSLTIQCILMVILTGGDFSNPAMYDLTSGGSLHVVFGGILAFFLFTFKVIIAFFKKDVIYKYGQFIGPIGFIGWSLGHWTSMINYYILAAYEPEVFVAPKYFWLGAILPFIIGMVIFLFVLVKRGGTGKGGFSNHQIAFILHGITFGYEKATKELLGTPALFKYVVPKTWMFLDKMMEKFGIDLKALERMNLNDALKEFLKRTAEIGMAEKIKIKWTSDKDFEIESVNCSTASVRSVMSKEELENSVCPWAIMTASLVSKITNKNLEILPSEFNEIGAVTKLKIID
jgi:hypothetical protein